MIVTVTLNAALDVTYEVDALIPHGSHRLTGVPHRRAGGKGVNVARVLAALGHPTLVTGFAGGPTGRAIRDDLRAAGLADALVPVADDSRRTLTVVSRRDGDATVFNEPGATVSTAEWDGFADRFPRLVQDAHVVVLSGSLPPGLPSDAYADLIRASHQAGAATVLDTSGSALLDALSAGPDIVKPNAAELLEATGRQDVARAAADLRTHGAKAVVVSQGPEGLLAVTRTASWHAVPPERLSGNPTGAGDACVAALAAGLADGLSWEAVLREAVALSAAAVPCPLAGDFDARLHHRFRTHVALEKIHAAHTY
ncbi:1-phosphofructokinase family hexose kinase [Streptomyces sp. NBC_00708]